MTRHSNLRCFQKIEYRSLYHVTIPDFGVKHGRDQDGRGGGPLQPEAGDDLGGEEERERHSYQ